MPGYEEDRATTGGFSPKRLTQVREVLERNVDSGFVPGAVAAVARHGEAHIEATGRIAFEGAGSGAPMAADTICRIASTTKPIVAACAMTLVEDCTLRLDDERVLSPASVTLMTSDHLTPAQKAVSRFAPGYFDDFGWGFGEAVRTRRTHLGPSVGSYGWNGGYGIIWYNDPAEDMTAILMIQRAAGRPTLPIFLDFFTAAYQAIDD